MRLTKIYTRKGDDGYTTIRDERLSKDDLLVEVIGTIDELNSHIGLITCIPINDQSIIDYTKQLQNDLFDLGGELHFPAHRVMTADKVTALEKKLDEWNKTLPPLKEFILPRGNMAACYAHIARTVCRRAERALVRLHRQTTLDNPDMLRYLNRLSDLLFVLARILARENNDKELLWQQHR